MGRDRLAEPQSIGIVGGGPAGALCAIQLRRLASEQGREIEVRVFDRKDFTSAGPSACNMCAGVISDNLVRRLESVGIHVPQEAVQRSIESYTLIVPGARITLRKPEGSRIFTAFRGGGPACIDDGPRRSLDEFLLQTASLGGAVPVRRLVRDVRLPSARSEPAVIVDAEGDEHAVDAVVGAFGVNSAAASLFEALGTGYRRPQTARAAQCELERPGEAADEDACDDLKVLCLGTPGVSMAALVPKKHHVTVSLIGRHVTRQHLTEFLEHTIVKRLLGWGAAAREPCCSCSPKLPVRAGRNVVADRLVIIGDAYASRYLKNGLDSAFITASMAASALVMGGASRENLHAHYVRPSRAVFHRDNLWGRLILGFHHVLTRWPCLARAHIAVARREVEQGAPGRLCSILWGMMTGDEPYRDLFMRAMHPALHLGVARAMMSSLLARVGDTKGCGE